MKRRVLIAGTVVLAAAILGGVLVARGRPDADVAPLRFAYQNRIGSALCIVAVEQRLVDEVGLALEAARFTSGPATSEALYAGAADIAAMGDTTAVIAVTRESRFSIVASHGAGEHRHRIVVAEDSPIRKPTDLIGARLAVRKGTSTYGGLLVFSERNGIDLSRIDVIDMGPSEMPDALAAGSIDAFVASEPTPSLAEARGAREIATLGGLGNNYPILLVARNDFLERRPEDTAKFVRAMRRAERFVRERPDDTIDLLVRVTGLSDDSVRAAMERHTYRLTLDEEIRDGLGATAEFLRSQNLIDRVPDWNAALASIVDAE